MKNYDSRTIATYFLKLADERGESLTPMQLIKLVYITHGWMLGLYHRPLIRDQVEAWQYGPVIRNLYNAVRQFGGGAVPNSDLYHGEALDEEAHDILSQVWRIYGDKSGPALSRLTHAKGTPWADVYESDSFGIPIPNDLIEDHYARKARKSGS